MTRYSTITGMLAFILLAGSPFLDAATFAAIYPAGLLAALASIAFYACND